LARSLEKVISIKGTPGSNEVTVADLGAVYHFTLAKSLQAIDTDCKTAKLAGLFPAIRNTSVIMGAARQDDG
jgi:hypothetical protein